MKFHSVDSYTIVKMILTVVVLSVFTEIRATACQAFYKGIEKNLAIRIYKWEAGKQKSELEGIAGCDTSSARKSYIKTSDCLSKNEGNNIDVNVIV